MHKKKWFVAIKAACLPCQEHQIALNMHSEIIMKIQIVLLSLALVSVAEAWNPPFPFGPNPYGYNMANPQPAPNYPMGNYQQQPVSNYPMANYQAQPYYSYALPSYQPQPHYNYPVPNYQQPNYNYHMENYQKQPAQVYYVHHIIPDLPNAKLDYDASEGEKEIEPEDMGFRSDSELFNGMNDDEVDERLFLLHTNTPYKRFNNFLQTMHNMRNQYRRRWKNGLRKNQYTITHGDDNY